MKSKDSRVLLFLILRSQKQLTLTAGKMMELSLESFTSVRYIETSSERKALIFFFIILRTDLNSLVQKYNLLEYECFGIISVATIGDAMKTQQPTF